MNPKAETLPLFCLETTDKKSCRKFFINFKASDEIPYPDIDVDEDQIVQEIYNPSHNIENYKIPLSLGQIFWSSEKANENELRNYVIDVYLNDRFAFRRIITSEIVRHYVVTVAMVSIEEKFNALNSNFVTRQFIGHKLELDQASYEILKNKQHIKRSNELVKNKVTIIDDDRNSSDSSQATDDTYLTYDLYYRPTSKLLTCSLQTDKLPDSISFNDDRIYVKHGEKPLIDICLPLQINLNEPIKYKFDDRVCLLRIVIKLTETLD